MKARVKATGKIVCIERNIDNCRGGYVASNGRIYNACDLELIVNEDPDYWTRLEHQYAGMAMNALLLTNNIRNGDLEGMRECNTNAMGIAYALIQKLKEKEERK